MFSILCSFVVVVAVGTGTQPELPKVPESGVEAVTDRLERLSDAVLQVRAKSGSKVVATGTGFFISKDSLAVTNLHVLEGADAAEASVHGDPEIYEMVLVAADPSRDIVLFRIVDKHKKKIWPSLELATHVPKPGSDVWALGYPKGVGYTVNRGIVSGVRAFQNLPQDLRTQLHYNTKSSWIQTDCTINSGNSGGPLVDAMGQVVGMNTWSIVSANNMYFALDGRDIDFVLRHHKPDSFSFADTKVLQSQTAAISADVPRIEVTPSSSPKQLIESANTLSHLFKCSACKGSGTQTITVRTGETRGGGDGFVWPIHQSQTSRCATCQGTGFTSSKTLGIWLAKVTERFVDVKEGEPDTGKAIDHTIDKISSVLEHNAAGLSLVINDGVVRQITATEIKIGTPTAAVGTLLADIVGRDNKTRYIAAKLQNGEQLVVISDPRRIDGQAGDVVIVGGLIAGKVKLASGENIVVLQGGYVLSHRIKLTK